MHALGHQQALRLPHHQDAELRDGAESYTTIKGKVSRKYFYERFHLRRRRPQTRGPLMPAYMNGKTGSWYAQCYYSDIDGNRKHKVKRGFATKGDALAWEADFLASADGSIVDALRGVREEYSEEREAKAQAQHLAHQGAHHPHEDSAVLRAEEDVRHHPQRRG